MKLKLLLISMILVGCSTKEPPQTVYQTVEVEVPVYQVPEFNIPKRPLLPVDALNDSHKDDHNAIGKAYVNCIIC
jgi:PBP1b-binding outer membrane lipoprotein LpoB